MPKPLKPALRHAPFKPFPLDVLEDKCEKEGAKDQVNADNRGTTIIDRVLPLSAEHLPCIHKRMDMQTAPLPELPPRPQFPTSKLDFSTHSVLSLPLLSAFKLQPHTIPVELIQDTQILHQESASACALQHRSPPKLPLPRRPPLPALAASGDAKTGPPPVTNIRLPPIPGVRSPRPPKRVETSLTFVFSAHV
ncbi:hypothetical protein DL96DRAFT_1821742 [Flagelloscypha sp. PMI_526]|nr:hypothetical protein DL96DRAFT_1821742 [Flagelloscypha sp. PMI_526]